MVEIDIYKDIASEQSGFFLSMFGMNPQVFSVDTVKNLLSENEKETDYKFNINCNGGSVDEGLTIYDILRTSGKNITMNIDGVCHSMAVTLLLSAPLENRTANPNTRALVHQVRGIIPDYATADDMKAYAAEIEADQNKILDIYAERTGTDRDILESIMKEERVLSANELIEYGFISKINKYNTNLKQTNMTKLKENLKKAVETINTKIDELLGDEPTTVNFDFMDSEGNVVISTTKEDGTLVVGDAVTSEDGTYTLENGNVVTVEGGIVTVIEEPMSEIDQLKAEIENLKAEKLELENAATAKDEVINSQTEVLVEAKETINLLKSEITSTVNIAGRITALKKSVETNQNEEIINKAKETYKKFKTN